MVEAQEKSHVATSAVERREKAPTGARRGGGVGVLGEVRAALPPAASQVHARPLALEAPGTGKGLARDGGVPAPPEAKARRVPRSSRGACAHSLTKLRRLIP